MKKQRINKYLSKCGLGSRRKCDQYIGDGLVEVNGNEVDNFGLKVNHEDEVRFKGKVVEPEITLYILLNKPVGMVTTLKDPEGRPTVAKYFKQLPLIKPVGRLDFNTSGVLLMTNDGELHYKLTHPKYQVPKLYKVNVKGTVPSDIKEKIRRGVRLDDGKVARGKVKQIDYLDGNSIILLELREGINREIRRIFKKMNYLINSLDRIEFAGLKKQGMSRGEWRYLSQKEVIKLKKC